MEGFSVLMPLLVIEGAVTLALVGLLIYRSILEFHEDDQIFLDRAEAALEMEQARTLQRILRMDTFIKWFALAFGGLFLLLAAIWVYQGLYA